MATLDLKTTLELMRNVDAARIKGKAAEAYVFFDRTAVKNELRQRLEAQGSHPDDTYLNQAITAWEDAQNRFVQPKHSFNYVLAGAYVNRAKIARWVGTPLLVLSLVAPLSWFALQQANNFRLRAAERSVESRIEEMYQEDAMLGGQINDLRNSPIRRELSPQQDQDLTARLTSANQRLTSIDTFFASFAPEGHADDVVTTTNYILASAHADSVAQQLGLARNDVTQATTLIQSRQILVQFANDAERLYSSIKAVAKDPEAITQADALVAEIKTYSASAHLSNLQSAVGKLSDIELALQQEYRMIITGGDTRCRDDSDYSKSQNIRRCEQGLNPKNYFVFIDSVDARGNLVRVSIRDEELATTLRVSHWGERVPESVYRAVERDYNDNGLFDKKELGAKRKGFLKPELQYDGTKLNRTDQITRKGN